MKYKVGDKVRINSLDWYNENKTKHGDVWFDNAVFTGGQSLYCGCELTICSVIDDRYYVNENDYYWMDEMIEGLVEEEVDLIPKFGEYSDNEPLDIPTMTTEFVKEHGLSCPNGYIFKDENGNVIEAKKIVLEKKKGYPKTYRECCDILDCYSFNVGFDRCETSEEDTLHNKLLALRELLICRDAYWKIAEEEMGLGEPWKPDWKDHELMCCIKVIGNTLKCVSEMNIQCILAFPTEEMRDAFYENFKEEIEICKELL